MSVSSNPYARPRVRVPRPWPPRKLFPATFERATSTLRLRGGCHVTELDDDGGVVETTFDSRGRLWSNVGDRLFLYGKEVGPVAAVAITAIAPDARSLTVRILHDELGATASVAVLVITGKAVEEHAKRERRRAKEAA